MFSSKVRHTTVRFFVAIVIVFALALGCLVALASEAHAKPRRRPVSTAGQSAAVARLNAEGHSVPGWLLRACRSSRGGEHTIFYQCALCASGRGHRLQRNGKGGFTGPYQFGHPYNTTHAPCPPECSSPNADWRMCEEQAAYRYMHGALHKGKRAKAWVHGQWGATCGSLR